MRSSGTDYTMRKTARICIIGNGPFANTAHYPSLASLQDVEIVGICAFDEERLYQTALKYKIPVKNIHVAKSPFDYQEKKKPPPRSLIH